jgi:hypothetical protein
MFWGDRLTKIAGVTLLLLAACVIANIALMIASSGDADPFAKDEIGDYLKDVHDNETLYVLSIVFSVAVDAVLNVAAAALLFLAFRERSRLLAAVGAVGLIGASMGFVAGDTGSILLAFLADDFASGGAGGIASGSEVTLEVARSAAIYRDVANQVGLTALALGLISFGCLIAEAPTTRGLVPPRWFGWTGMLAGAIAIASWIAAVSEVAGIVLFVAANLLALVFVIALGAWLWGQPEGEGAVG